MAAGLLAWRLGFLGASGSGKAPDPLASINAEAIVSTALFTGGEPQPMTAERKQAIASAVASLKAAPRLDGRKINWASATQVRARTTDGVMLTLQAVPADAGGVARVTADPIPGVAGAADRAQAIRALRHNAYKLDLAAAAALLQR